MTTNVTTNDNAPTTVEKARQLAGDARLLDALDHLAKAREHLDLACSDLSPVIGFTKEWDQISKISDAVRRKFYRVKDRRHNVIDGRIPRDADHEYGMLDHAPTAQELRRHAGCGGGQ